MGQRITLLGLNLTETRSCIISHLMVCPKHCILKEVTVLLTTLYSEVGGRLQNQYSLGHLLKYICDLCILTDFLLAILIFVMPYSTLEGLGFCSVTCKVIVYAWLLRIVWFLWLNLLYAFCLPLEFCEWRNCFKGESCLKPSVYLFYLPCHLNFVKLLLCTFLAGWFWLARQWWISWAAKADTELATSDSKSASYNWFSSSWDSISICWVHDATSAAWCGSHCGTFLFIFSTKSCTHHSI